MAVHCETFTIIQQTINHDKRINSSPIQVSSPSFKVYIGNLADHTATWHTITSDPWVLKTISGYHLEFGKQPTRAKPPCPTMLSHSEVHILFLEINPLLEKGIIEDT